MTYHNFINCTKQGGEKHKHEHAHARDTAHVVVLMTRDHVFETMKKYRIYHFAFFQNFFIIFFHIFSKTLKKIQNVKFRVFTDLQKFSYHA